MCGLVGILNKDNHLSSNKVLAKSMLELLAVDTIRGVDSTGLALVPFAVKENIRLIKKTVPGWDFADMRGVRGAAELGPYELYMGHNRAATKGGVSVDNAHPFWMNEGDAIKELVFMHNGTVYNKHALPSGDNYNTDSEAICASFAQIGVEETVSKINGSFSFVWWNVEDRTLNFLRNSERPMHLAYDKNARHLFFASELDMIKLALHRNTMTIGKCLLPQPGDWWCFDINDVTKPLFKKKVKMYEAPKTSSTWYGKPGGVWDPKAGKYVYDDGGTRDQKNLPTVTGTGTTTTYQTGGNKKKNADLYKEFKEWSGKEVEMMVVDVDSHGRHGHTMLDGCMLSDPYLNCRIYMRQASDLYGPEDNIRAKVVGVCPDPYNPGDVILVLDSNNFTLTTGKVSPGEFIDFEVEGPDGRIPVSHWDKLTAKGCAMCTGNLHLKDHKYIGWTPDNQPLCPGCSKEVFGGNAVLVQ